MTRFIFGFTSKHLLADRRVLVGVYTVINSLRYTGKLSSLRHLKTIKATLYETRCFIGSQCNSLSKDVMLCYVMLILLVPNPEGTENYCGYVPRSCSRSRALDGEGDMMG